jgi:ATP-dependent protease HslVU (ClpYQ) peptidase subunit
MTCIVGMVEDGVVYIGGDALASETVGNHVVARADEKVFANGDFLFGFCGSFRIGQLLRYAFTPPEQGNKNDMAYMVVDFIDAVRRTCKKKGVLKKVDEEESSESTFLVGYKGKLYVVEGDFDVGCHADSYCAIGAGAHFALGSLHTTQGLTFTAKERICMALQAAAAYNSAVRGPFIIRSLPEQ